MNTLALIGVGRWGRNIVSTLEKIPNAHLAYLCGTSPESLGAYPPTYEKVFNWRELLKKEDLDAVLIATPPSTHTEIAAAFLEASVAVFVEKPMVLHTADAEILRTLVKKRGIVFMVGYQYLFNDYIRYLKKEIERGTFGKILSVKSEHVLSPSRPDVDIFWDAGPHPLSVFQCLFNPRKLISAERKIEHDSASVTVRFENAPTLQILASCLGETKTRKLTVAGEKATAVLDEALEKNKLAITQNGKTSFPEGSEREALHNELEHFMRCLQTGARPLTDINFGCQITQWLEEISRRLS